MCLCIHGGAGAPSCSPIFLQQPRMHQYRSHHFFFFFLKDPPYSASDKHCSHWLCSLSSTQTTKSQCCSGFVWFVTRKFPSVNTLLRPCFGSTYQPRHAADAAAERVTVDGDYRGNHGSQTGRKGRRRLAVELCRFVTFKKKKLTDALSMERQHREAAENNRRKPIRVGVGRSSKQTSEIQSNASRMDKQNTGSGGPSVIPMKEVSVGCFSVIKSFDRLMK